MELSVAISISVANDTGPLHGYHAVQNKMINYCSGGAVIACNSGRLEQNHQSIHWSATITRQNVHVQMKQVKNLIINIILLPSSQSQLQLSWAELVLISAKKELTTHPCTQESKKLK